MAYNFLVSISLDEVEKPSHLGRPSIIRDRFPNHETMIDIMQKNFSDWPSVKVIPL